jgi:hypothetical protein
LRPRIRVLIASALVSGIGLAQPLERGAVRMVWKAPAECPTDLQVLARIEGLLGTAVSGLALPDLAARGRITLLAPEHYELVLETFQGEQRFLRTMQAASCAELTDAGALVLALAIDPTLSERRASASPSRGSSSPPATAQSPTVAPRAERPEAATTTARPGVHSPESPPPRRSARFLFGARGVVDFGTVADVAIGPGIGAAFQWRTLEASLDGVWLPPRRTLAAPGKGGDISLAAVGLRGCYRPLSGAVEALACAVFELGSLDGGGVGTVIRTHRTGLWAAPGAAIAGRLRLGSRLLLSLGGGTLVPIEPIDFTLDNVGLVRRVPPLVARVEAGVHAHFD